VCHAVKSKLSNIYVLAIYRAPKGDFEMFLNKLENMNYLYKTKAEFVIYGDINIDYRAESYHKQCLNPILTSFNLMSR
jgi:hypothetical protein